MKSSKVPIIKKYDSLNKMKLSIMIKKRFIKQECNEVVKLTSCFLKT